MNDERHRCPWCGMEPLYVSYHDEEWGVPLHDDTKLFEFLVLEGAQAGLSWRTILKRRDGYRRAFAHFDPRIVAEYGESDMERLVHDPGIIRNRLKIRSAINNARCFLEIQEEFGSFDSYIWRFVNGKPIQNSWHALKDIPALTDEARNMSKDLKKRGFSFVGPTICYAHMQATGMVNDHLRSCFRYDEIRDMSERNRS